MSAQRLRMFYGWWVALTAALAWLGWFLNTATIIVFPFGIFAKAMRGEFHSEREETSPCTFANSALSSYLGTGVPGSVRSLVIFWGTETYYRPFGEILYSIRTGQSARSELFGMDG